MIKKLLTTVLTLTLLTTTTPVFASTTSTTDTTGWRYYYKGHMGTDIVQVNDKLYYFDDNGTLITNSWISYGNYKMYADTNGVLITGWKFIDNNWYYFSQSRIMQTGVYDVDGKSYSFDKDGHWIG